MTDSKETVINLINKRIEQVSAYWEDYGFIAKTASKELKRLRNLKSVMENLPLSSIKYQKEKLEKKIEILNKRYNIWLAGDIERKGNPNARTLYNTEVGLNHLRRQRRNLNYILELSNNENN